jgi:hypothetical protein
MADSRTTGDEIGTLEIDMYFCTMAEHRLAPKSQLQTDIKDVASAMTSSFQRHRDDFGTDHSMLQQTKAIAVPGFPETFDSEVLRIRRGRMIFENREFQNLFERQIQKAYSLLNYQMARMLHITPGAEITHIILSGSLGVIEYFRLKMRSKYFTDPPLQFCRGGTRFTRFLTTSMP